MGYQNVEKTLYRLYYFYGGIGDRHEEEGTFESLEALIKYHQKHRNTELYNFPDFGQDYVEVFTIKEEEKKCIYRPEAKEKKSRTDAIVEFLENTLKRLNEC